MAKMFYSLQETAEKLGVSEDKIKEMAKDGKLQQFRDRDKLMFKRDQVDTLAVSDAKDESSLGALLEESEPGLSTGAMSGSGDDIGVSTGAIPLADSADAIDLAEDADHLPGEKKAKSEDSRMATGISVFDAGEIEEADPHTQTIVTPVEDEEELALESVGSGSGLLDLTQESDDTSLGAELLDEIYPGGEGSDAKLESAPSSSGAFDSAPMGESGASGLDFTATDGGREPVGETVVYDTAEPSDPAGNGLSIGMLLVGFVALVITMLIAISAVLNAPLDLTQLLVKTENGLEGHKTIWMYSGITLAVAVILGVIGYFIGRGQAAKS